jgi:hypothetical protein
VKVSGNTVAVVKQFISPVVFVDPFAAVRGRSVELIAESEFAVFDDIKLVGIPDTEVPFDVR